MNIASLIGAIGVGAQTGLGYMAQQQNAQAASQRGRFAADVAERNAQLAERQRDDVLNLGSLEESRLRSQVGQEVASGRAAAAGQGIDINVGSAAAGRTQQAALGELDALTIRNNAARAAWGYDVDAANERMNGRLALLSGENEAAQQRVASYGTLLSGAADLYGLSKMRVPKSGSAGSAAPLGRRVDDPLIGSNQRYG